MLFITEITDAKARKIAGDFLGASEKRAQEVAPYFDTASKISFGPVKQRGRSAAFNLRGYTNGATAEMTIAIPQDMPEADAWFIWAWLFEDAGLRVELDAPYRDFVYGGIDAEMAQYEAAYEADPAAFVAALFGRCAERAAPAH